VNLSKIYPFATLFCRLILTWAYENLYILARHDVNGTDCVLKGILLSSMEIHRWVPIPNEFIADQVIMLR